MSVETPIKSDPLSTRTIIRNFSAMLFLPGAARGIVLLMQVLLAWILSLNEYGVFAIAMSFCAISYGILDFGLCTTLIRKISKNPSETLSSLGGGMSIKIVILVLGTVFCAACALGLYGLTHQAFAILLLLPAYAMFSTLDLLRTPFRAHERMHWDTGLMVLDRSLAAALCLLALHLWGSLMAGLTGFTAGALLASLPTLWAVHKHFGIPRVRGGLVNFKKSWPALWPVGVSLTLAMACVRLNVILTGLLSSESQVALYAVALNLVMVLQMTSYAFRESLFPTMSRLAETSLDHSKALLARAVKIAFFFSAPLVLCLYWNSEYIVRMIYPGAYGEAAPVFTILILGFLCTPITNLLVGFMRSVSDDRPILLLTVIDIVLLLAVAFLLIPANGARGAACAALVIEGVNLLFCALWIGLKYRIFPDFWTILRFSLSMAFGLCFSMSVPDWHPLLMMAGTCILMFFTFIILGGFSFQILNDLRKTWIVRRPGPSERALVDQAWYRKSPAYDSFRQRYEVGKEISTGARVLEFCCGEGAGTERLASTARSVLGFDRSESAVMKARERCSHLQNVNLEIHDALNWSRSGSDVVVAFECLEHFDEERGRQFIARLAESVGEEGILLLTTPDGYTPEWGRLYRLINPFHLRQYTEKELDSMLRAAFKGDVWIHVVKNSDAPYFFVLASNGVIPKDKKALVQRMTAIRHGNRNYSFAFLRAVSRMEAARARYFSARLASFRAFVKRPASGAGLRCFALALAGHRVWHLIRGKRP